MDKYYKFKNLVIGEFFDSAMSDVESSIILFRDENRRYFLNSIILLSLALEKLLKARLFAISPLLLKKDTKPSDLMLLHKEPQSFGVNFIQSQQHLFIGLDQAWKLVCQEDPEIEDNYHGIFADIKRYRNHHVHTFCRLPTEITMKATYFTLIKMLEQIHSKLYDMKFSTHKDIKDSIYPEIYDDLFELIEDFQIAGELEAVRLKNLELIKKYKIKTIKQFSKYNKDWHSDHDIPDIECPFCFEENGFTGATIEADYREDKEGDLMVFEPPSGFSAEFHCFVCLSCGAFVDSETIFDELEVGSEMVKPHALTFDWDIDNGVNDIKPSFPDRKGYFDGIEVMWH